MINGNWLFIGAIAILLNACGASKSETSEVKETFYPTCASPTSDPDGDGWGWENNRSCKVGVVKSISGGYPVCSYASSDPDGDTWGYENGRSCRVTGQSLGSYGKPQAPIQANAPAPTFNGYPYCLSPKSDPDGDGWGWEFNRSCKVK